MPDARDSGTTREDGFVMALDEVERLRGALDEAGTLLAGALLGHEDGMVAVHEFRRGEVADLEMALHAIRRAYGENVEPLQASRRRSA